jgi:hypothetical protein
MCYVRRVFLISLLLLPLYNVYAQKQVVGWVENSKIYPGGILVKAKIDTGAKTSSINCNCITPFRKNNEDWIRFSIENTKGELQWFERKISRVAIIKRHFGKKQKRYVVKLGLCLGNVYKETDFSLIDRSGLNYQVLVGRRFLKGTHIVDPGRTFVTQPVCKVSN